MRRFASVAFFLAFAASALWSGRAQAQIEFRETFGAANATLPTAQSTADGNWANSSCLNGRIVGSGGDSASDGAASTHYLFHNTASCAYAAGQAVWRTVSPITVQPNRSYVFSYWTMVVNQVSDPVLTQVVTPNAGAVTVLSTVNTAYPATNNTWIRRMVVFVTGATTTAVSLRINNGSTAATGNDFGIDDVMLATMPTIALTKTTQSGADGPFGFALTNTRQTSGTVTTTTAGTPAVVDGDSNAAITDFTVAALGTAVTIDESTLPSLWNFASASCTNSAGATVGTLSGRQITIPAAAVVAGERFTCAYVNSTPPSFGSCSSTMYLGVGDPTQLHRIDTSSNPLTYPTIGAPASPGYNAMGYDPASNYIYATRWDTATSLYRLLRIAANGVAQDVGMISGGGINASGSGIASGEIGADGFYYVKHNVATNQMWRINLDTGAATLITLNQSIASGDLAWSNGRLYAHDHDTGLFHSIHPTTGAVTTIGPSGIVGPTDAFGSMIGASNGVFGRRNSGGFFKFDLATGQATLISDAPAGSGDGAMCATAAVAFAADLAISKTDGSATYTPGNNVVYTIVVSNDGPFGVQNAQVVDALPTGVTSATWTCGSATGGGVCSAASGSGAINTTANLPAGASVTYMLTLQVPSTFSGNLVNTATVTAPTGTTDSNTGNNSASDTDTQFPLPPANVADIRCTADPNLFDTAYDGAGGRMTSGADTYWQAAVTGPNQTSVPAGLSYSTAQVIAPLASHFAASPYPTANWIAHNSTGFQGPTTQRNDYFFRYQFNLGPGVDPAAFRLAMNLMADNAVENVYVNGTPSNVRSNYGATDPYVYAGFTTANTATGVLSGPWQSGLNEIVVHVKSQGDYMGFLAEGTPQPLCAAATVALNKITQRVAGGPFGFGLTNTVQATGTVTTTAIDAPVQVDGDTSTAGTAEPFAVAAFGTDVVITENSLPSGWLLSDAVCTSGGTPVGSRSGSAYTIPGDTIDASGENFVCTFTNTPTVNLRLDKTVNPTTVRAGQTVTYTIVANNNGPGPGDGAVLRDPAVTGMDCSAATLTCNATGGAVCPSTLDVPTLQTTGLVIPDFPAGGALQFGMVCTVTATGL